MPRTPVSPPGRLTCGNATRPGPAAYAAEPRSCPIELSQGAGAWVPLRNRPLQVDGSGRTYHPPGKVSHRFTPRQRPLIRPTISFGS